MKGLQGWQVALLLLVAGTGLVLMFLPLEDSNSKSPAGDSYDMELEIGFSGEFPEKYTCDGQNVSPPLSFETPEEAESVAVVIDDPDAPARVFDHWTIWNITSDELPENLPEQRELDSGALQGENDFGEIGYNGPCPPTGTHTYRIKAYALDTQPELEPGSTREELETAMQGHVLAQDTVERSY